MRIAIVSSLFPPFAIGGAEEAAAQLALGLRDAGHEVAVVSTCRRADLKHGDCRIDNWEGIPVWRIAPWNLYWKFDQALENPNRLRRTAWHALDLWNISTTFPLDRVLSGIAPEVINTHNIDGLSPVVWRIAHRHTEAIAHTLHDCHLLCPRATMRKRNGTPCDRLCAGCRGYAAYHLLFRRYVKLLIAPAKATAEVHKQAGWPAPRIAVIANGLDAAPVQVPAAPQDGPLRVVFMSRLEREKGCEALIRVIEQCRQSDGIDFHVAGKGTYAAKFENLCRDFPNVKWRGFVTGSAKQDLLTNGDVFLQLSECHENAPLSLIEAKRYGLYLIGSRIGGIPEIIDSAEAGMLLQPGNASALFAILRDLRDTRKALRANRATRVKGAGAYGRLEMAQQYAGAFRSLLDTNGSRLAVRRASAL